MAWFSDLAGKAEHFLNKIDSEAASILTEDQSSDAQNSGHSRLTSVVISRQHFTDSNSSKKKHLVSSSSVPGNLNKLKSSTSYSSGNRPASSASTRHYNISTTAGHYSPDYVSGYDDKCSVGNSPAASQSSHSRQSSISSMPGKFMADYSDNNVATVTSGYTTINLDAESTSNEEVGSSRGSECSSSQMFVKVEPTDLTISPPLSTASDESNNHIMSHSTEASLLKKEIHSLNQEMVQLLTRTKQAEKEIHALRSSQANGNSQQQATERLLRELQQRELDLEESVAAKDSQIAVLRVRLQEKDEEASYKFKQMEELRTQNASLCEGVSASSGFHSQALQNAQDKIREIQSYLEREKNLHKSSIEANSQRIEQLESEQHEMLKQVKEAQTKLSSEANKQTHFLTQITNFKYEISNTRQEYDQYKIKASGILQSKEDIIIQLKKGLNIDDNNSGHSYILNSELNQARIELNLCREELGKVNEGLNKTRAEYNELERINENESMNHVTNMNELQEELGITNQNKCELQQENKQIRDELRYSQEELSRLKISLTTQLSERENEIEKLRRQVCLKTNSSSSSEELERKIKSLTEIVIEKQNKIEQLNTSLQGSTLQLKRLQSLYDESQAMLNRDHTGNQSYILDEVRQRVPMLLTESPFDTGVTRRVKRAYTTLDRLSVGIGLLLRRNPIARILVLVYMLLLHVWVMVVLLTYTPEIHTHSDYNGFNGDKSEQHPPMPN